MGSTTSRLATAVWLKAQGSTAVYLSHKLLVVSLVHLSLVVGNQCNNYNTCILYSAALHAELQTTPVAFLKGIWMSCPTKTILNMSNINTYIAITSSGNKMNAARYCSMATYWQLTFTIRWSLITDHAAQLGWESSCHLKYKLCSSALLGSALHCSRRLPLNLQLYLYSLQWNLLWEVEGHDR